MTMEFSLYVMAGSIWKSPRNGHGEDILEQILEPDNYDWPTCNNKEGKMITVRFQQLERDFEVPTKVLLWGRIYRRIRKVKLASTAMRGKPCLLNNVCQLCNAYEKGYGLYSCTVEATNSPFLQMPLCSDASRPWPGHPSRICFLIYHWCICTYA